MLAFILSLACNVLSFSRELRQSHIVSGRSICACLSVLFKQPEDIFSNNRTESANKPNKKMSRTNISEALHERIETFLQILRCAAVPGFIVRSADKSNIPFHMLLISYAADTPQCADMLSEKRGTQTSSHATFLW